MNLFGAPSSSRTRLLCAAALCALGISIPAKAPGYVLTGASWPSNSNVTFQMALGSAGRTLSDGNTSWDLAALPAGAAWNQNILRLVLLLPQNPSAPVSQGDGVNTVAFGSSFFGNSFGSNTLAMTGWSTRNGVTVEADVIFNNRLSWDSYRGGLRYGSGGAAIGEIRRVLIHELGHAIGLKHPDTAGQNVSAIMNSVMSAVELPTTDDVNGAQALYGAPTGATPTPTPTPAPTATPTPTPTATPTPTPIVPTVILSASPAKLSAGTATYTVSASFVTVQAPVIVNFTMSGSAKEGRQYQLSAGQFTIPAGSTTADVTLTVLKAGRRLKIATMTLAGGSGYTRGPSSSASVTISK